MMITNIEDYFTKGCGRCERFATPHCVTRQWAEGLMSLRGLCLGVGLDEALKWGHPCYVHSGRNVAILGAFKEDFRLSFFDATLLKDPERILEKRGPNTVHADMIRFTANEAVGGRRLQIEAYLQEAIQYAKAGIKPLKTERTVELPEELIDAMRVDSDLAAAFEALTPGRQRSYVIQLNGAKKAETRIARIAKFRDKILAGKGANER